jgi:hypothetical protein
MNLLANGSFTEAAARGQEPRFLFPLSGAVPAQWELRATPTECGRVALGTAIAGVRALRIEGAWDTQLMQVQTVRAGRLYVAEGLLRGRSSPGNDAALTFAFLDAAGGRVGEYRTVMLPKGESDWRRLVLADVAPDGARYVVVGVSALRQFGGDWLEVTGIALRAIQTAEDGGQRTEGGGRMTEGGGRKTEGRWRRTED